MNEPPCGERFAPVCLDPSVAEVAEEEAVCGIRELDCALGGRSAHPARIPVMELPPRPLAAPAAATLALRARANDDRGLRSRGE